MTSRSRVIRGTTFGGFAFACLSVAALSGVALALAYDVRQPQDSIALILLTNPGARLFRNLHYWAAQFFLLLSAVHAWDHLRRGTERRMSGAMWTRVTLSIPVAAFLMFSGFLLRGDAESMQALRIASASLGSLPVVGRLLSLGLFGVSAGSLQLVYVHHVATATFLTWVFAAEHARAMWPRRLPVLIALGSLTAVAAWVAPTLHDGLDPLVRGPWYFLAVQEALHWVGQPIWIVAAALAALGAVLVAPRIASGRATSWLKRGLAAALVGYLALTVGVTLCRGENWALESPSPARVTGLSIDPAWAVPSTAALRATTIPVVLGRREGCVFCHAGTTGLGAAHRPDAVGCASCHAGNPFSLDKRVAHRGLALIPGNLSIARRTCALTQCHPGAVERVTRSVMTTMSGIVAVDRAVFGQPGPAQADVSALTQSPPDTHLRQLCASCHLGAEKRELGWVDEQSRGGGCNACHLVYSPDARAGLARYRRERAATNLVHPDVSIAVTDDHCFGCHSRSGRIATSYAGWHEDGVGAADGVGGIHRAGAVDGAGATVGAGRADRAGGAGRGVRRLLDGRVLVSQRQDVHFEKGMRCVDCHTAREVMGDGSLHARKRDQVRIRCEDCHSATPRIERYDALDAMSRRIVDIRTRQKQAAGRQAPPVAARLLATRTGDDVFVNTRVDDAGVVSLAAKGTNETLPLKPPRAACVGDRAHARLTCASCHTAWAPRCANCHTSFNPSVQGYDHLLDAEVRGSWTEAGANYRAEPPTLGVAIERDRLGTRRDVIDTFIPGMVIRLDRNMTSGRPPDTIFRRLYARTSAHTTARVSRSCRSCHNDPVALGYGEGSLVYGADGRWRFAPARAASSYDRLPDAAWVGFLQARGDLASTREDARPLNVAEQKRVLAVGACLTCHPPESRVMRDGLADFARVVARASRRCILPDWQ